eukprot:ANDGO_01722.mRNA.1 hypothetical protein
MSLHCNRFVRIDLSRQKLRNVGQVTHTQFDPIERILYCSTDRGVFVRIVLPRFERHDHDHNRHHDHDRVLSTSKVGDACPSAWVAGGKNSQSCMFSTLLETMVCSPAMEGVSAWIMRSGAKSVNIGWLTFHAFSDLKCVYFVQQHASAVLKASLEDDATVMIADPGVSVHVVHERVRDAVVDMHGVVKYRERDEDEDCPRIVVAYSSNRIDVLENDLLMCSTVVENAVRKPLAAAAGAANALVTKTCWFAEDVVVVGTCTSTMHVLQVAPFDGNPGDSRPDDEDVDLPHEYRFIEVLEILKERNRCLALACDTPVMVAGNSDGGLFAYRITQHPNGDWEYGMLDFQHISAFMAQPSTSKSIDALTVAQDKRDPFDLGVRCAAVDSASGRFAACSQMAWFVQVLPNFQSDRDNEDSLIHNEQERFSGLLDILGSEDNVTVRDEVVSVAFERTGVVMVTRSGRIVFEQLDRVQEVQPRIHRSPIPGMDRVSGGDGGGGNSIITSPLHTLSSPDIQENGQALPAQQPQQPVLESEFDVVPSRRDPMWNDSFEDNPDVAPKPLSPPVQFESPARQSPKRTPKRTPGSSGNVDADHFDRNSDVPPQPSFQQPPRPFKSPEKHISSSAARSPLPALQILNPEKTLSILSRRNDEAAGSIPAHAAALFASPKERSIAALSAQIQALSSATFTPRPPPQSSSAGTGSGSAAPLSLSQSANIDRSVLSKPLVSVDAPAEQSIRKQHRKVPIQVDPQWLEKKKSGPKVSIQDGYSDQLFNVFPDLDPKPSIHELTSVLSLRLTEEEKEARDRQCAVDKTRKRFEEFCSQFPV